MRWTAPVLVLVLLPAMLHAQAIEPPPQPSPPSISPEVARRLSTLARSAMLRYLASRQGPMDQPIPAELQAPARRFNGMNLTLGDLPFDVTVTLRSDGRVVATAVGKDRGLARNVISAALQAMRSPNLPNRISADVLMGLTLDVSVSGRPEPLEDKQVEAAIVPGLIGLKLTRGMEDPGLTLQSVDPIFREIEILPSQAYRLGWGSAQMKRQCLRMMGSDPMASGLSDRWAVFVTTHLVDYPDDGGTWQLYRGKLLTPVEMLNDEAFQATARNIANWLLRNIDDEGQLHGSRTPLADQCYGAWALARWSVHSESPEALAAAEAIVGYVAKNFVRLDETANQAHVFTRRPGQEVTATAMFLLATTDLDPTPETRDVQGQLARWLLANIDTLDKDKHALELALLLLAVYRADLPEHQPDTAHLDTLLLGVGAGRPGEPADPAELKTRSITALAWTARALLASGVQDKPRLAKLGQIAAAIGQTQRLLGGPLDAFGGYGRRDPSTVATGATVAMLGESALVLRGPKTTAEMQAQLAGPMNDARRFCCRMTYRPEEAFFVPADERNAWAGAVREVPRSAQPSVQAAAAALEAFITP